MATAGHEQTDAGVSQRILIVRLGAMGDVIHALPAAASLRAAFPGATIGWAIEERWAELLCARESERSGPRSPQKPLVDWIHVVNTKAWRMALLSDETWKEAFRAVRELREAHYDAVVDFQGAVKSALLGQLSGAATRFGFVQPREKTATMFYTREVHPQGAHVIEQNLSLAAAVGRASPPVAFPLPLDPATEGWCDTQLQQHGVRDFVIINPGAGWGAKQWPPEGYGEVAQALASDGWKPLINFGPGEEWLARAVEGASGGAAEAVPCSLGELIALTRRARLFIGGDTGPMHLAAALGVPVVAIFGPTDPARNGPYGTRSIVLRSPESRTSHARRAQPEAGLLRISAAAVIEAARQLLSSQGMVEGIG